MLVGQTQGDLRVAALRKQEGAAPAPAAPWPFVHLQTELPPSCPVHKSTVCAHGVVLASGTRYLGGGLSGWCDLPEAGRVTDARLEAGGGLLRGRWAHGSPIPAPPRGLRPRPPRPAAARPPSSHWKLLSSSQMGTLRPEAGLPQGRTAQPGWVGTRLLPKPFPMLQGFQNHPAHTEGAELLWRPHRWVFEWRVSGQAPAGPVVFSAPSRRAEVCPCWVGAPSPFQAGPGTSDIRHPQGQVWGGA